MGRIAVYAMFVIVVLAIGFGTGMTVEPGGWYESLVKPSFTPPNSVFGPVWGVMYLLIAVAGARTLLRERTERPFWLWIIIPALTFIWTPIFFGAQMTVLAAVVVVALWLAVAVFIRDRWQKDPPTAWMMVIYLLWLTYATALNLGIVWLN
ncbi:CrtK/TspO family sensor protein [Haematobacter missouriensis]|uniref:Tryptophan-rich sensory protein n=1 Tax=Haematobacter missouriensis TaxID=366616 RepID=A0A212ATY2_9RHOB|nr:TspO/MBR family protein [Haematobacter missouriensis]KFI33242.1 CrtK/TspO family sensor protein [Haematobacter missouriensis]OWJ75751.1 tryptophan-rich sensory protein [Haematobacter missouriensis]OWJ84940.1 tryptophan-rich sensory protein [Haematobacter missouriensis]